MLLDRHLQLHSAWNISIFLFRHRCDLFGKKSIANLHARNKRTYFFLLSRQVVVAFAIFKSPRKHLIEMHEIQQIAYRWRNKQQNRQFTDDACAVARPIRTVPFNNNKIDTFHFLSIAIILITMFQYRRFSSNLRCSYCSAFGASPFQLLLATTCALSIILICWIINEIMHKLDEIGMIWKDCGSAG